MHQGRYATKVVLVFAVLVCTSAFAAAPPGASLSGEFSVTPSGAASYSLPLLTPPGVLKPALAINYSSQAGNGLLGMGWSLDGLSSISRCPRVKSIDGVDDGALGFTANDRLCLDGQRLILKSGSAYGASGAEYRTQIERFSKIVGYGDFGSAASWFRVWKKNGEVLEFGNSPDSRLLVTPAGGRATPYSWALNKLSDRFSNYYTVSYLQDFGISYPQTVRYSGNAKAGTPSTRTLSFDWTPAKVRPDSLPSHVGGGVRPTVRFRLAGIGNNINPARYRLNYSQSSAGLSQLTRLEYCPDGGTTNCLAVQGKYGSDRDPASGKRMGDAQLVLRAFGTAQGWGDMNVHPRQLADVNGDGRLDIVGFASNGVYVAYGTASGFAAPVHKLAAFGASPSAGQWGNNSQVPRMVVDINGDGLADIVGFASAGVVVSLSTGNGFAPPAQWVAGYGLLEGWTDQDAFPRTLADVDGDGLLDIVGFATNTVVVALNKRTSFVKSAAYSKLTGFTKAAGWTSNQQFPRRVIDMNGDGRADIVGFHVNGIYVANSTPGGFVFNGLWSGENWASKTDRPSTCLTVTSWPNQSVAPRMLADVNGDGLPDIVGFNVLSEVNRNPQPRDPLLCPFNRQYNRYTSQIYVALNSGFSIFPRAQVGAEFGVAHFPNGQVAAANNFFNSLYNYPKVVADIDFDGHDDILRFDMANCIQAYASTGAGLSAAACFSSAFPATNSGMFEVTDLQGGGLSLLAFSQDGVRVANSTARYPNQIISLRDDLAESTITYSTLADTAAYQKGAGSVFPVTEIQAPYQVVTAISGPDGIGGTRKTFYRYGGLRSHFDYGSLGFQWMESMDAATGALDFSEFKQQFPLTGSLYRTQKQRCSGTAQVPWTGCEVLSQEVSNWSFSGAGATADRKVYLPFIVNTTESNWIKTSQ